jgi:hypothetical protein
MKFAMIVDGCTQHSYYVIDNKSYSLKSNNLVSYSHHHSIGNECHLGIWGWPFVFDEGYFINWTEWDELPNLDLDIIMVAIERHPERYNVSMLRKAYPNALIVSFIKEATWSNLTYNQRSDFFKQCDYVTFPWDIPADINMLETTLNRKVYYMPQPHNIEYLNKRYYSENRHAIILDYKPPQRLADNSIILDISNKFSLPTKSHIVKYKGPYHRQWEEFLDGIKDCAFCFNLDESYYGGSMGVQCAALGIINFGGIQDSHKILWPDLATNDEQILKEKFEQIINNTELHMSYVKNAYIRAQSIYGYEAVKKRFLKMIQ